MAASNQMHVQMKNGLSSARTNVEHGSVAILDAALACDAGGGKMATPDQIPVFGRSFFEPSDVLFRNHEYMSGSLRVDVFKRIDGFIRVDFLGRYFAADDAAEQTVVHDTSQFLILQSSRDTTPAALGGSDCLLYPIAQELGSEIADTSGADGPMDSIRNPYILRSAREDCVPRAT